jgi:hypothetical protein
VVSLIQSLFFVTFIILFGFLLRRKQLNFWFLLCLLSPATLAFPVWDWLATGRKEIILFLLFALYMLCLNKGWLKDSVIFLFTFALMVATLFHELVFFYVPYFLVAAYLKSIVSDEPTYSRKTLWIALGALLVIIPLSIFGQKINGSEIAAGLMARGLAHQIGDGILSWPNNFGAHDVGGWAVSRGYLMTYGSTLFLSLLPFILFTKYSGSQRLTINRFIVVLACLFLFTLPLFVLAVDWGRWIHIHCILLLMTLTILLENQKMDAMSEWADNYLVFPELWATPTISLKIASNTIWSFLCVAYITLWCLPICGTLNKHTMDLYLCLYRFTSALF